MSKPKAQKDYPDFCKEVDALSADQLKARIVGIQQALAESESCKESDDELKQARAKLSELNGPYQDVKKAVKIKTSYLVELLAEKGKLQPY